MLSAHKVSAFHTLILITTTLLLFSCKGRNANSANLSSATVSYTPRYAQRFELLALGKDKILKVHNPWQGARDVEMVYRLTETPTSDPKDIKYPVTRAICLSSTHVAFLDVLNRVDKIVAVSGANYITNPTIRERVSKGEVFDVGYESSLSYELIASLQADVVFAYGVEGEMAGVEKKLNEMGVKLVYIGEYMEQSPLAKAEWLVAMAAFFGDEQIAQERFNEIAQRYESIKSKAEGVPYKPKVMLNAPYKGSWYVPGGASHIACLLKDSGSDYLYGNNQKVESTPISLEAAFIKCQEADFWLNPNAATSLAEVRQMDERLSAIPAFKNRKMYNNNARTTSGGGSDFWESGVVQPHIILEDLVAIFHPELYPEHKLYYFRHLE